MDFGKRGDVEFQTSISANDFSVGTYWLTMNLDGIYMEAKAIVKSGY
jgi:hypothetical protein